MDGIIIDGILLPKELIIDDDDTSELNKKCMRIYKKEDKIIIDFINRSFFFIRK